MQLHRKVDVTQLEPETVRLLNFDFCFRLANEGLVSYWHDGQIRAGQEWDRVIGVNGALVGGASLKASDFLAIAAGC